MLIAKLAPVLFNYAVVLQHHQADVMLDYFSLCTVRNSQMIAIAMANNARYSLHLQFRSRC
jgi:hypothetical protein